MQRIVETAPTSSDYGVCMDVPASSAEAPQALAFLPRRKEAQSYSDIEDEEFFEAIDRTVRQMIDEKIPFQDLKMFMKMRNSNKTIPSHILHLLCRYNNVTLLKGVLERLQSVCLSRIVI